MAVVSGKPLESTAAESPERQAAAGAHPARRPRRLYVPNTAPAPAHEDAKARARGLGLDVERLLDVNTPGEETHFQIAYQFLGDLQRYLESPSQVAPRRGRPPSNRNPEPDALALPWLPDLSVLLAKEPPVIRFALDFPLSGGGARSGAYEIVLRALLFQSA
jgi:hypothetical protein